MQSKVEHLKLIKPEDKKLTIFEDEELKKQICISITSGKCTIPEDVVKLFNIPYDQVIHLLSDTQFLTVLNKFTQSKLQLLFHTQVPNKLQEIIQSDDNKDSLQAMKLAAQLSNNLKANTIDINNNLQINVENLVKEAEKQVNTKPIDIPNEEYRKVS